MNVLHLPMVKNPSRRNFLRSAPLAAAAAGLPLATKSMFAETAGEAAPPTPFQLFTAGKQAESMKTLVAKPGNDNLFTSPTLTAVMTVETKKAGKEFEWHEGRDHVFQILEGTTIYEVGGTPQNGHNTKPGEWLAPISEGSTKIVLKKGDMLVIPRGTPHKRTTENSVTLLLISGQDKA
jgi:mannose-6-phosphate isomerase-like protein (cupin superfamily)